MGFIEDLRGEKQRREEYQQRHREATDQEEKFKKGKETEKLDRINKQRELSASYICKSKFWEFAQELHSILGRESNVSSYGEQLSDDDVNSHIVLQWDRNNNNPEGARDNWHSKKWNYAKKQVRITFTPEGSIFVSGRETYALSLDQWIDNPRLQEKTLEKAYKKPLLLQDDSGVTSDPRDHSY